MRIRILAQGIDLPLNLERCHFVDCPGQGHLRFRDLLGGQALDRTAQILNPGCDNRFDRLVDERGRQFGQSDDIHVDGNRSRRLLDNCRLNRLRYRRLCLTFSRSLHHTRKIRGSVFGRHKPDRRIAPRNLPDLHPRRGHLQRDLVQPQCRPAKELMGRHSVGHMQTIQPQLSRVLDHRFRVMLAAIHQLPVQFQFAVSDFNLHATVEIGLKGPQTDMRQFEGERSLQGFQLQRALALNGALLIEPKTG